MSFLTWIGLGLPAGFASRAMSKRLKSKIAGVRGSML